MRFVIGIILLICVQQSHAQINYQNFDGADTNYYNSLHLVLDTLPGNVWQIGKPQKTIFDEAFTIPNAIITDTIISYPINSNSSFLIGGRRPGIGKILAIRWLQKLDLDSGADAAIVEYSLDSGATWRNAFADSFTHNFYGWNSPNFQTVNGVDAFSGTDTSWKDVWLCFDNLELMAITDSIVLRFTLLSDSVQNNREGWMLDNFRMHPTYVHTITEAESSDYFKLYPTLTTGEVHIICNIEKHIDLKIDRVEVLNTEGRIIDRFRTNQNQFSLNLEKHPPGVYRIRIFAGQRSKTYSVQLAGK